LGLTSCQQTDQGHPKNLIDGYLLTPNQKALFNYFTPNTTIQFFDSVNQAVIQIQEVSEIDVDSAEFHTGGDIGERFTTNYEVLSNISPKFGVGCYLIANRNNACVLEISFDSDSNNIYISSDFSFNPYDSNKSDTTYTPPGGIGILSGTYTYQLLDSITFSSHTFYNVYYLKTPLYGDSLAVVNNCYYSLSKGIVGFQIHQDSSFWIRGN
jgi:hypothetical protein